MLRLSRIPVRLDHDLVMAARLWRPSICQQASVIQLDRGVFYGMDGRDNDPPARAEANVDGQCVKLATAGEGPAMTGTKCFT